MHWLMWGDDWFLGFRCSACGDIVLAGPGDRLPDACAACGGSAERVEDMTAEDIARELEAGCVGCRQRCPGGCWKIDRLGGEAARLIREGRKE